MESIVTQENDDFSYWEKVASGSSALRYTSEIEKASIVKAHALAQNPTTALEVGCEGGRWSHLLAELGWKLTCIEVDQASLNICQKRIPTATCILVNPADTTFPCGTESMDLLLCIEVPTVMHSDWFIDEASRVLQPRGLIVGVFWNRSSWRGLIHRAIAPMRSGDDFWYLLSYAAWKKRFQCQGFHMVDEVGMCWLPFRRKSNSPLISVATRLERFIRLNKLVRFSPLIVFIAQKE